MGNTWGYDASTRDIILSTDHRLVYSGMCLVVLTGASPAPAVAFSPTEQGPTDEPRAFSPLSGEVV